MHLNTKKIAFAGVMLALTEVGIALGSVIETNTLFLLAAAPGIVYILVSYIYGKIMVMQIIAL